MKARVLLTKNKTKSLSCVLVGSALMGIMAINTAANATTGSMPEKGELTLRQIIEQQSPELLQKEEKDTVDTNDHSHSFSVSPDDLKKAINAQSKTNHASQPATPTLNEVIANYPLTVALLGKLERIHSEIIQLPEPQIDDNIDNVHGGIDAFQKAFEKRPDIMSVLGRNLMTAKQYIIAMQAVSNAFAHAVGAEEEQNMNDHTQISAQNLAFGKKYKDRIRQMLIQ